VILGLVILTVFLSLTKLATDLPMYLNEASQQAAATLPPEVAGSEAETSPTQISINFGPVLQGLVANIAGLVTQFGISLLIFFFMLSAAIALPGAARLGLDPSAPVVGRVAVLTEDVRRYMTILTGVNFAVGMGNTVFLWILGIDYALLWGILAWFMGYIPSIGFFIALIPPVLIAWAEYGWTTALIVLIGYILINGSIQNFVQPKIMGQGLRISPVVVFVSLFVWAFLLGGIGAILAVPMTLLVLALLENFESTRTLTVLMRYTGEKEGREGERRAAIDQMKGLYSKVRASFSSSPTER
jgi:predicted PurR-regulated permease PerM